MSGKRRGKLAGGTLWFCAALVIWNSHAELFVSSHNSNAVLRYNETNGTFVDVFVPAGRGGLSAPHGIRFGPDGNLYVASANNDSIIRYDGASGALIDLFVTSGRGGLDYPAG